MILRRSEVCYFTHLRFNKLKGKGIFLRSYKKLKSPWAALYVQEEKLFE